MNNLRYLGFLGFLGFLGVAPLLAGDWFGALWLFWFLWFLYFFNRGGSAQNINDAQVAQKRENVERVLAAVQQKGEITNDEVQALLGVSDATAERYLAELEGEGKVQQIGAEGRSVSYRFVSKQ